MAFAPPEFQSRAKCRDYLGAELNTSFGAWNESVIDGLTDACAVRDAATPPGVLAFRFGRWVVRDDDLKAFQSLRDGLTALAAVDFLLRAPTASTVTGIVMAVASVAINGYRYGATLDAKQVAVIAALKAAGAAVSAAELAETLSAEERTMSADEVDHALVSLRSVWTRAGTVSLVEPDQAGRWTLRGV